MHPTILVTKIEPPRLAAGSIDRPRLLALLSLVRTKPLTLIRAAAGFGKTSVGAAWAERLIENGDRVAWLSLDREDDVPTRLLYYAGHALQRACERLGSAMVDMVTEVSLLPVETIISALINDLAELDDDVFLFLDDYQHIADSAIHEGIAFLLRHASSNFHLVLISRTEPPLALARLRAQNELLEVDASTLRFDLAETRRFLEHENLVRTDAAEVTTLYATTDGWPAALRLIASATARSADGLDGFLRSVASAPRSIENYIDDVLATLPPETVTFMMRTSIFDRFSAQLCDAVTGATSSRDLLSSIEKRQLLMIQLGRDECWYRYHPLLGEFLRQRLETRLGGERTKLHRRASHWFASQELWTEAVENALAAGDTAEALAWIENCSMAMVKKGELLTLLGWQRQFPDEVMRNQLNVRLSVAWGMALAMRFDESLALLSDIERDLDARSEPADEDIASECTTIRAVNVALQDDSSAALALAEACIKSRTKDPWNTNVASNVVRFGLWKSGKVEASYAVPWEPYSEEDDRRNVFSHVYRLCLQGLVELQKLRFDIAERHLLEALRRSAEQVGPQSTCVALPATVLAQIRYEQGRLDEAEILIGDRLPVINATGMLESVLSTYVVLARIAANRSNVERAYALLEQGSSLAYARHWGRLIAATEVERVKLYIGEGRLAEASASLKHLDRLVVDYSAPELCAWSEIENYRSLAYAHVALARRDSVKAVEILLALREVALRGQRQYFGLRVETLLSLALLDAGESTRAIEVLGEVVTRAAAAGLYRTILEFGPEIGFMLQRLRETYDRKATAGVLANYVDSLLDDWRTLYQRNSAQGNSRDLANALTPREDAILRLMAAGNTNKEMAKSLGIAPETVKSHIKNIFVKLSVERRAQAIARAQNLGILRTTVH